MPINFSMGRWKRKWTLVAWNKRTNEWKQQQWRKIDRNSFTGKNEMRCSRIRRLVLIRLINWFISLILIGCTFFSSCSQKMRSKRGARREERVLKSLLNLFLQFYFSQTTSFDGIKMGYMNHRTIARKRNLCSKWKRISGVGIRQQNPNLKDHTRRERVSDSDTERELKSKRKI